MGCADVTSEGAEAEDTEGVERGFDTAEVELAEAATEAPAVEMAGGDDEPITSEDAEVVTDIAAAEGDSDDPDVAETAETADMAETADVADTTDAVEPETAVPEGEAEISETTRKSNVTACAEPGSVGADVWKEAQL